MTSRRRDSLQNLDKQLKELSRRLPPEDEFFGALLELADNKPSHAALDRATALIAAQFLDRALQSAISICLAKDAREKEIFDSNGAPLETLSAKIIMGRGLGIISDQDREDLDTIRLIRNAFAHSLTHISFTDDAVIALCGALNGTMVSKAARQILEPKRLFVVVAGQLYFKLKTYLPILD